MIQKLIALTLDFLLFIFLMRLEILIFISSKIKTRHAREKRKENQSFFEWLFFKRFSDILPNSRLFGYYLNFLLYPIFLVALVILNIFNLINDFGGYVLKMHFAINAIPLIIIFFKDGLYKKD